MNTEKNIVLNIDKTIIENRASAILKKMSGAEQSGGQYDRIMKTSAQTKELIEDRIDTKIIYSYYHKITISDITVMINGQSFECPAFQQIEPKSVKGAYVYFMTSGDYSLDDQPILQQLFADMWGTAFIDALREYFECMLSKQVKLSDGFGPGFYGMNILQMHNVAALVKPSLIGVELRENGIMLPLKSCGGIYFSVDDKYKKLNNQCRDCRGTVSSCSLCNIKKDKKMFKCTGICSTCGRCKNGGMLTNVNKRKTSMMVLPKDFLPQTDEEGYGIAFDIGTTTIVGILWDIGKGVMLGSAAKTNPQNEYGMDVISRITFSMEKDGNLSILRSSVLNCLNNIIEELSSKAGIDKHEIIRSTVCGNTTMSHLFAGYDPSSLAHAPFEPAYRGHIFLNCVQSGLEINEKGIVMLLPNIAGHVGGDITAGILANRLMLKKRTLYIDIGTNGEIVLADNGKAYACSTAAGPAFEGASIFQGMRAAPGAIEKIRIENDDVLFNAIDNKPPEGICGSGLIDAIAEMLNHGIINKTGRIASATEYAKKHPESMLSERLRESEIGRSFILVFKEGRKDIMITQNDVREVQLAKGAIAAGIRIMLNKFDYSQKDLNAIIVAGAFGNYINKENAVTIGLLPDVSINKIHFSGNSAGIGCLIALASGDEAKEAQAIPSKVEHVELAKAPDFQKIYVDSMSFK